MRELKRSRAFESDSETLLDDASIDEIYDDLCYSFKREKKYVEIFKSSNRAGYVQPNMNAMFRISLQKSRNPNNVVVEYCSFYGSPKKWVFYNGGDYSKWLDEYYPAF